MKDMIHLVRNWIFIEDRYNVVDLPLNLELFLFKSLETWILVALKGVGSEWIILGEKYKNGTKPVFSLKLVLRGISPPVLNLPTSTTTHIVLC
jgi:hypothetical protein